MNDLQIFEYETKQKVRTKVIDGKVWFVAADVCKVLGIANPWDAISVLPAKYKGDLGISDVTGRQQKMNVISESGLYRLVLRSTKAEAEKFQDWIVEDVLPSIRRTGTYSLSGHHITQKTSFHIRYEHNQHSVAPGYFSVINELMVVLDAKLEAAGYFIPDKAPDGKEIRPDVSVGKRLAKYLTDLFPELAHKFKTYIHKFEDGVEVEARMYEDSLLALFRKFVHEVWIKEHAYEYFQARDPKAIEYLVKLIPDIKIPRLAIA